MRTTVTLEPDTQQLLERLMRERGITFKQALNQAIRLGLAPPGERSSPQSYTTPRPLGPARVDLIKALGLADSFEDEAIARRA